jgi:putative DNA primase/helicase
MILQMVRSQPNPVPSTLLSAAKQYRDSLGWSVFPTAYKSKMPNRGDRWKPYQTELISDAELDRIYGKFPQSGIGLATGKLSGVVVVDLDGSDAVDYFENTYGAEYMNTIRQSTGRAGGGMHLFFRYPDGASRVPSSAGQLHASIDIRGDGGLVVLAPSLHRTGRAYQWQGIDPLEDGLDDLLDLPGGLLSDIMSATGGAKTTTTHQTGQQTGLVDTKSDLLNLARGVAEGGRNDACARLAGHYARESGGDFLATLGIMSGWNENNDPPLSQGELEKVVNSICGLEKNRVASNPQAGQATFRLTDSGNGERFAAQHGDRVRFCHQHKRWYFYDGTRWARDLSGKTAQLAKESARSIFGDIGPTTPDGAVKKISAWALKSESNQRRKSMLELAQSEPGIPVTPGDLDADPWKLNVLNGTLDLKTGKLNPHSPADLISKLAPVVFDPKATAPRWEKFLSEIQTPPVADFLRRWAGYSLTGATAEEVFVFCLGSGANGKSKFINPIRRLLGTYAKSGERSTFMTKNGGGIPCDVAMLDGARMVPLMELAENQTLNEPLIQGFTGGDPVVARFMRADFFEFVPVAKLWLAGNHPIRVKGESYAIWRRCRIVPFDVTIRPGQRDKHLERKLMAEASGILNWCLRGLEDYLKGGMQIPEEVKQATDAYRGKSDPIRAFLNERCTLNDNSACPRALLFSEYQDWSSLSDKNPLSAVAFGRALKKYDIYDDGKRSVGGESVRHWGGVRLKSAFNPQSDDCNALN